MRVAALLASDHPEAEKILLDIIGNRQIEIDIPSLALCVNALSILILERGDAQLFDNLLKVASSNPNSSSQLMPIICSNLTSSVKLGFQKRLVEALEISCQNPKDSKVFNDLKWQLCSLAISEKPKSWRFLLKLFNKETDVFLEGLLVSLAMQYPLPGFPITQWNTIERPLSAMDQEQLKTYLKSTVFIRTPGGLIR